MSIINVFLEIKPRALHMLGKLFITKVPFCPSSDLGSQAVGSINELQCNERPYLKKGEEVSIEEHSEH